MQDDPEFEKKTCIGKGGDWHLGDDGTDMENEKLFPAEKTPTKARIVYLTGRMGFVYWSSSAPNTFSVALTTGRSFTARINGIQVTNHGGRNPQSPIRLLWFGFGRQPAQPSPP